MTVKELKESLALCDDAAIVSVEACGEGHAITALLNDKCANLVRVYLVNDGEPEIPRPSIICC